jgi:hypothetical protein
MSNNNFSEKPPNGIRLRWLHQRRTIAVVGILGVLLIVVLATCLTLTRPFTSSSSSSAPSSTQKFPRQRIRLFIAVNGPLVDTRLDPIVHPGTCSGHVHSVFGNAQAFASTIPTQSDEEEEVSLLLDDKDWRNDTAVDKELGTTSNVIPNKSIYW